MLSTVAILSCYSLTLFLTMHYDAFDEFNNKACGKVSLNDFPCELPDLLSQT